MGKRDFQRQMQTRVRSDQRANDPQNILRLEEARDWFIGASEGYFAQTVHTPSTIPSFAQVQRAFRLDPRIGIVLYVPQQLAKTDEKYCAFIGRSGTKDSIIPDGKMLELLAKTSPIRVVIDDAHKPGYREDIEQLVNRALRPHNLRAQDLEMREPLSRYISARYGGG